MRRPGPALRVALLGVTATLTGFALLAGWLGWHAYAYDKARDRATARVSGLIVEDGIGDEEDIRVRWTDRTGREHVQRFAIYDTDRYTKGRHFAVVHDPHQADPRGFPGDPEETAEEDDLLVPILLAGIVAAGLCSVWAWRGLRFRWAARRPGRPMTATVCRGRQARGAGQLSESVWLTLTEPGREDGPVVRQRVMWHPALDDHTGPVEVTAHHKAGTRGALVARLPDGTRLVPLGRLRRRPPRRVVLDTYATVRSSLRDSFTPVDATALSARFWWRPAAWMAGVGLVVGGLFGGFVVGGSAVAAVGMALCLATLLTALWSLSAPEP
ncbi:hypothetical protein [Streptomyces triticisoli]|jgi:hypothetical protein|uniref:hypothetical protein n=1 Tax=Streptomyces triticisoli TaxID=2182797 RepID=UPI000DD92865|nr:hypothetical protein [Streptomyces triticisoli]